MANNALTTQGMVGAQSSFAFPRNYILPAGYPQPKLQSGGQGGVPGAVGSVAADGSASGAVSYGAQTAQQPAHQQPIWYGVVAFVLGGIMLAHAAHHETRRR